MRRACSLIIAMLSLTSVAFAQNTFSLSGGAADPGDVVAVQATFDTVDISQGWSFGICNNPGMTVLSAVDGATTLTVNNGGEPDFNQINISAEGVTVGLVINILGGATMPVGTGYQIMDLTYQIGTEFGTFDLCYCETLGVPPVATVLVVDGASVVPDLVCGTWEIAEPPTFGITDFLCVGDVDQVTITWSATDNFEYFTLHKDGELLAFLEPTEVEYVDTDVLPGESYFYSLIGVAFPDATGPAFIQEEICDLTIVALEIYGVTAGASGFFYGGDLVTIDGLGFTVGANLEVDFGGILGTDLIVIDDSTLTVVSPSAMALGTVDIGVTNSIGADSLADAFFYGFVRGDVDCNRAVDIADAQSLLLYLFAGGTAPCCFDAADGNDDGQLDAADPIAILFHLFDSGPLLPAPFPAVLGETLDPADVGMDPTDDSLICF